MTRRISVRGVVVSDGRLLCAQLFNRQSTVKVPNDWWCLPGGGLEDGEAILDGLYREMIEETGIAPVVGNLLFVQQFQDEAREYLDFFFHITNAEVYARINLASTTHGAAEIAAMAFHDPSSIRLLPEFLATEPLADMTTTNQPPKVISRL